MKAKMLKLATIVFIIILSVVSYILIKDFLEYKESEDSSMELIETVMTEEKGDEKEKEKTNID